MNRLENTLGSQIVNLPISSSNIEKTLQFLQEYVKPEQVTPIIETCRDVFGCVMQNPVLLVGGRGTSQIIKFEANNHPYICRVVDATRPSFFIDPESEIHNMWAVNNLDVAPKLHHADLQAGIIIMDYIQPTRLTTDTLDDEQQISHLYAELGKKAKLLHGGPSFTETATNVFDDLESTLQTAKIDRAPDVAREVLEHVRNLAPVLNRHEVCTPCHKDLHSNNILLTDKSAFFIDWELGANCNRFVDLACLSIFFVFDAKYDDLLLEHYFGEKPTEEQQAQLFLMKQVCLAFYGIRLLRRVTGIGGMDLSKEQVNPNSLPAFRDFILSKYNCCSESFTTEQLKVFPFMFLHEAKKNIDSARFSEAIRVLTQDTNMVEMNAPDSPKSRIESEMKFFAEL
ncbi:MAG: phosphotransferase [Verrucomicrobia bacterium]|nr:phosphotransferase [Verrucomicrobiota bacterium]